MTVDVRFRSELALRLGPDPWPEWLADVAYLAGAVLATAVCVFVLPFPVSSTWWIGGALAGLGFVVHSVLADALAEQDASLT